MPNLLTLNYDSINHYLVECRGGRLLIDPGWAGSLAHLQNALQRYGIEPSQIKVVMMTHNHPDHGGLTQEVKQAFGARLLIHEKQIPYLGELATFYQRRGGYVPIVVGLDDLVVGGHSRQALNSIGVNGELVVTPGHSDDSVSLVTDDGAAFVGDLHLPGHVDADRIQAIAASWHKLIALNAQTAYPGHGNPIPIQRIAEMLSET